MSHPPDNQQGAGRINVNRASGAPSISPRLSNIPQNPQPNAPVIINGSGFTPNGHATLNLQVDLSPPTVTVDDVVCDASGAFQRTTGMPAGVNLEAWATDTTTKAVSNRLIISSIPPKPPAPPSPIPGLPRFLWLVGSDTPDAPDLSQILFGPVQLYSTQKRMAAPVPGLPQFLWVMGSDTPDAPDPKQVLFGPIPLSSSQAGESRAKRALFSTKSAPVLYFLGQILVIDGYLRGVANIAKVTGAMQLSIASVELICSLALIALSFQAMRKGLSQFIRSFIGR